MILPLRHKNNHRGVLKRLEEAPQPENDLRSAEWLRRLAQPRGPSCGGT